MRYIRKAKEPESLTHARKTYLKKYTDMREDLKDEIKASLLKEQKYLYAFLDSI
jgi:pyrroloquinoline quinone (PQQ) biosynthesis protein C